MLRPVSEADEGQLGFIHDVESHALYKFKAHDDLRTAVMVGNAEDSTPNGLRQIVWNLFITFQK